MSWENGRPPHPSIQGRLIDECSDHEKEREFPEGLEFIKVAVRIQYRSLANEIITACLRRMDDKQDRLLGGADSENLESLVGYFRAPRWGQPFRYRTCGGRVSI